MATRPSHTIPWTAAISTHGEQSRSLFKIADRLAAMRPAVMSWITHQPGVQLEPASEAVRIPSASSNSSNNNWLGMPTTFCNQSLGSARPFGYMMDFGSVPVLLTLIWLYSIVSCVDNIASPLLIHHCSGANNSAWNGLNFLQNSTAKSLPLLVSLAVLLEWYHYLPK